ncbi:unnamed protein product [Rhizoctonia solani]|uniref:Zn(2)-C6 fungal-type domain-containing protein n=1 Tax=Rhizoctonia solani TaxID=456999 RepID=A0A8H3GC93_9AGAM|nr:unnamed protein product [Rhizoctonia solani]
MRYSDCLTCEARNKKCDRTNNPNGCRRCAQAGIKCGGYVAAKPLKARHRARHDESQTSIGPRATAHYDHHPPPDLASNELKKATDKDEWSQLYGEIQAPNIASRSVEDSFAVSGFVNEQGQGGLSPWNSNYQLPDRRSHNHGTSSYPTNLRKQKSTPSIQSSSSQVKDASVSSSIVQLLEGGFNLRLEDVAVVPELSEARQGWNSGPQLVPTKQVELVFTPEDIGNDLDGSIDTESVQVVAKRLVLDPGIESNFFAFVLHGYAAWANQFFFEPTRTLLEFKNNIYLWIKRDTRLAMIMTNTGLALSSSTDYDLTDYRVMEEMALENVLQARARGLKGTEAMMAIAHSHKYITNLRLVSSFASVLGMIELLAPVVRRACPEPDNEFINLPRALTSNLNIQYYVMMDVMQSVVTHRPMHFRYNLEFSSPWTEEIMNSDDLQTPRMMPLYGIPDRLIVTFARMNTLFEDFGNRVSPERIAEVEREIVAYGPVAWSSVEIGSIRALGRIVAHECWALAAHVYLYMGLCGADSYDPRVVKTQKAFMRMLRGIKLSRHPDSFLVLPMFILGMASNTPWDNGKRYQDDAD